MSEKYRNIESMLYRYSGNKNEIKDIDIEIAKIKDEYQGIAGIGYEERVAGGEINGSIVESEILSKEKRIERLRDKKMKIKRESEKVENALEFLTDIERIVIENKYFNGLQWWQICSVIRYSERWAKQIRKEAIDRLVNRINL